MARRAEAPFRPAASGRLLPLIIAVMVFLATMALIAALALNNAVGRWDDNLSGGLTVRIATGNASVAATAAEVQSALAELRQTPGVATARALSEGELAALLEPWLGKGNLGPDLPVPHLLDVTLEPGADVDLAALTQRLTAVAPSAVLDDHRTWLDQLVRLARWAQIVAVAAIVVLGLSAIVVVAFAIQADLASQTHAAEVLHLIGARDSYIARQFQGHALALGLRGGVLGMALALATFLALARFAAGFDAPLLPRLDLGPFDWAAVAAVPLAAALITTTTAHLTVMRALRRLP